MKNLSIITVALFSLLTVGEATGQKAQRQSQQGQNGQPAVSIRAESLYNTTPLSSDEVIWMREIYRQIDMEKEEKNMPLYYPTEPVNGQMNLFTILFKLVCNDKVPAYEYLDGREQFTDSARIKVKDILDKFHILYSETGSGRIISYRVDDSDIPGAEVKSYYIKERYYFDQRTSEYRTEVEALCPILHREGEFGGEAVKYPMFWIEYKALRPHLLQTRVMAGNLNNATTQTMDDFFVLRQYKGEIYKTANLRNITLMQYCPTPDSLAREQERIEMQLTSFEKNLWNDSLYMDSAKVEQKATVPSKSSGRTTRTTRSSSPSTQSTTAKAPKQKSTSNNTGNAPIRSVRRK